MGFELFISLEQTLINTKHSNSKTNTNKIRIHQIYIIILKVSKPWHETERPNTNVPKYTETYPYVLKSIEIYWKVYLCVFWVHDVELALLAARCVHWTHGKKPTSPSQGFAGFCNWSSFIFDQMRIRKKRGQ